MATNLFNELARYYGAGQQRRILEDEKVAAEERGFEQLTPVRAKKQAEALAARRDIEALEEEGAIRAEQRVDVRTQATEARKRAQEMEDRGMIHELLAPTLEREMPPTITEKGVAPEATAEILRERPVTEVTPFRVPKGAPLPAYKELYDLLEKRQAAKKETTPKTPFQVGREIALGEGKSPRDSLQAGIDANAASVGASTLTKEKIKTAKDLDEMEGTVQAVDLLNMSARRLMTAENWPAAKAQGAMLKAGAMVGWNSEAVLYEKQRNLFFEVLGRQLGGRKGVMTELDAQQILSVYPSFGDTKETVELNLGLINNAVSAAVAAKTAFINGEISLEEARKRVASRNTELFRVHDAAVRKAKGLPPLKSRPKGLDPAWSER